MNLVTNLARRLFGATAPAVYPVPVEVWPEAVRVRPRGLECGESVSATFLVADYPAEVTLAWLDSLIDTGLHAEVSLHVEPVDSVVAASRLKRRRARLESSRRLDANKDRLDDPYVEAAAADAAELAGRVATGDTRLFQLGVYVTVHADTEPDLDAAREHLRSCAAAAMLDLRPVTWRQLPGRATTLPLGVDALRALRTVDTDTIAAAFPLTSPDAPNPPTGVLYGLNIATGALVIWDRWSQDNHNSILVARSGAGKSYFTKTEILRQSYDGVAVTVIDPDGEYEPLANHVGGAVVHPGRPGIHINPLDLPADPSPDALTRRVLFAGTLASTLLGEVPSRDDAAALDDAVLAAYQAAGITHDPATWNRAAPTMRDVSQHLNNEQGDEAGRRLAARLGKYLDGGLSDLFTGPTTIAPDAALTVYSLRDVADELLPATTALILDRIWNTITETGPRRLVVVDEAWRLLSTGPGATFLARLAKSARKRRAGLMTVTQDAEDVLSTELGRVVIQNSATQILMRQSPQAMRLVTESFGLTDAEHAFLTTARRGEALLRAGDVHVAFTSIASEAEHDLCLTGLPDNGDRS